MVFQSTCSDPDLYFFCRSSRFLLSMNSEFLLELVKKGRLKGDNLSKIYDDMIEIFRIHFKRPVSTKLEGLNSSNRMRIHVQLSHER